MGSSWRTCLWRRMIIPKLSTLLDKFISLLPRQVEKPQEIKPEEDNLNKDDNNESEKSVEDVTQASLSNLPPCEEIHPFAPTEHFAPAVDVYNNCDSSNPNWLPGLPRPPPGVFVQPPRDRSRRERLRYLSQLNSYNRPSEPVPNFALKYYAVMIIGFGIVCIGS